MLQNMISGLGINRSLPSRNGPQCITQPTRGFSLNRPLTRALSDPSGLSTMPKEVRVFLNLFVESKELENVTQSLVKLPEVTDVYEVTGEYDIVCMLRVESILAFRNVLKDKVLKINGVRSTVSSVVLYEHKREGKPVSE